MDDFEIELKNGFLEEAAQLLSEVEQAFLQLESNPGDLPTIERIFRLAHNLKGSAKAVGFDRLGEFTHELENYLLKLKDGRIRADRGSVSLLLRTNDFLTQWVAALQGDFNANPDMQSLMQELRDGASASAPAAEAAPTASVIAETDESFLTPEAAAELESSEETPMAAGAEIAEAVREATSESISETVAAPASAPASSAASAPKAPAKAAADESIRISLARLEKLLNFVGEMVILHSVLNEQAYQNEPSLLRKTIHQLGKVTKEVQELSMGLRMIPVKQTFQKMQRIVRDTSSALDKQVNLTISGEETELDKTVLEQLGDPLVHLIRNAVDHGIESAEGRKAAGKSPVGEVRLSAFHRSGSLIIEIQDDGAGLDPARLRAKAVEKGILPANRALSDQEAYQLIFASGFSTKAQTTDISGRGVGMDVVRTNIERLKGDIHIETEKGKFTRFQIRLPLTLAIIDGLIVMGQGSRYVIPLAHVHESVRPAPTDVHPVPGFGEIYCLRGENLPLYRLSTLTGAKEAAKSAADSIAIVVRALAQPFAVLVDDIVSQTQVVVKQLGGEHASLVGYGGSAILGDGKPALILELPELVSKKSASPAKPKERKSA